MKIQSQQVPKEKLRLTLRERLESPHSRLGLITSITGLEVVTVILDTESGGFEVWITEARGEYPAATPVVPQAHWFERRIDDLFAINPHGHPRSKSTLSKKAFDVSIAPLNLVNRSRPMDSVRDHSYLEVEGKGVYEIPVGPVHAGIIEPGHFRLSCLGEVIQNLELRFGYVHRGVELRLTEVPFKKTRFIAEAAASDTVAANTLANAVCLESLLEVEVPRRAQILRTLALEIERLAMHTCDLGGMAVDLGMSAVAANFSVLRGSVLGLAELLSGSRLIKSYICPGGVSREPGDNIPLMKSLVDELNVKLDAAIHSLLDNTYVQERLIGTGIVTKSLASDFDLVGITARASGVVYDTRLFFDHGLYPEYAPEPAIESSGDAFARTKVRATEVKTSLALISNLLELAVDSDPVLVSIPDQLPADGIGVAVVEAHRGELIHLIFTNDDGKIARYMIKDPSMNNWTAMAIAARNELIADFPVCNKSFSLSYSGHDL